MNESEFLQWLEHHGETFPQFARHVRELPAETIEAWCESMTGISLASAKLATKQLFESREPLFSAEDHVRAVRRLCDYQPPAERPAKGRYRCLTCMDSGFVSCYDPGLVKAVLEGGDVARAMIYDEIAVRCSCSWSQESDGHRGLSRYNPRNFCKVERRPLTEESARAEITAWAESREQRKRA